MVIYSYPMVHLEWPETFYLFVLFIFFFFFDLFNKLFRCTLLLFCLKSKVLSIGELGAQEDLFKSYRMQISEDI